MKTYKLELNEEQFHQVDLAVHIEKAHADNAAHDANGQNKEKFIQKVRTLEDIQKKLKTAVKSAS